MAATQAEKQQNDVNSEKVQPDQHSNVRNSLLQNGTDKNNAIWAGGGSVMVTKTNKNTGSKNQSLCIEMSQYRQETGGGGGEHQLPSQGLGSDPGNESVSGPGAGTAAVDSSGYASMPPSESVPSDSYGGGGGFPFSSNRSDVHNSSDSVMSGMHQAFTRSTPGFGASVKSSAGVFSPQHPQPQRFVVSGQTLSQPIGPTPTLNQLLQSSNPVHRHPNNYEQPYNQGWPPQKSYNANNPPGAPFRNQASLSPAYSGVTTTASPGYSEGGRGPWPGPPVTGQHGPGSPGPPSQATVPTNQASPQPSQPPSHSPGPASGLPPSPSQHQGSTNQHQGFPNRPAQPTTPNAHAPDQADLSGGNSNDSSGGPAPGTPNSQGMRPTPSPTGSTGSRSMSPAVGQQNLPMPPRPSSGQSDGACSTRMSHSPMATQGGYPPPPSHLHTSGYKTHPAMVPPPGGQQLSSMYQPSQQYQQGAYPSRPQYPGQGGSYGPLSGQAPASTGTGGMPPQSAYGQTGRQAQSGVVNHMGNTGTSQFPPYQQSWSNVPTGPPTPAGSNHVPGKGPGNGPPPPSVSAPNSPSGGIGSQGAVGPRPPHYLKTHLQHKMGFGQPPSSSPSPPQGNYHMGPPSHHSGMGPPPSMGPPANMPPATSPLLSNSHPTGPHDVPPSGQLGPMPPPSSTPNSHHQDMMDNGITTTAVSGLGTHVTSAAGGSVTSVVTTGPDGTPIDEGSQQSTLSNASAASGEDPQCTTPKSRKNDMGHYSHPTTPQSTVPSPGAASMNSIHEDYGEISSPSWPRTPASPKTDSLGKLYDMDDNPERRSWLDKLLAFMEERRTPITTCPTISKNPLDLFRLYVFVKERGGFMEVTKNKTWKDIAGMLGIGASSSAAYTLRKHYTKNLLAYECQFDRGGIDPQPIINQVEATSKKKSAKAASVPSPGSSNSQDSFPTPGSGGGSMDGYGGYGYPPGTNPDYNTPSQRPSSQTNAPSPHAGNATAGAGGTNPAGVGPDNVNVSNPFDDVSPSPPPRGGTFPGGSHPPYPTATPPRSQGQAGYANQSQGYNQYPTPGGPGAPSDQYSPYSSATQGYQANRSVYPPYSTESAATGGPPASPNSAQAGTAQQQSQDPYRYIAGTPASNYSPRPTYTPAPSTGGPPSTQQAQVPYPAQQQEYYRSDQPNAAVGSYPGGPPPNKNMPPPVTQPRRHPDFAKDQQGYPQYGQRLPMYGAWPNNNQFRGQYQSTTGGQQWNQTNRPPTPGQWDRYPTSGQGYQPPQAQQQQWSPMPAPGVGQSSPLRPPLGPRAPGKPYMMQQSGTGVKGAQPQSGTSPGYAGQGQLPKREITFPPDSVEATMPVLYRRKRLSRVDLGPVDAWRIIMCLRSGLLAESCYALDMLNVLLFDDASVPYFGLNQWPGLMDLLLEHFRKNLSDMFDGPYPPKAVNDDRYVDLGCVDDPIETNAKTLILHETSNYTMVTRKGYQVKLEKADDVFVRDHHKDWDTKGDAAGINIRAEINSDPWHLTTEHILSTFQAEFGQIPFYKEIENKLQVKEEEDEEEVEEDVDTGDDVVGDIIVKVEQSVTPPPEVIPPTKPSDKKRRTKTLSDVISRIRKDTTDDNDLNLLDTKSKISSSIVATTADNSNDTLSSTITTTSSSTTSSSSAASTPVTTDSSNGSSTILPSANEDSSSAEVETKHFLPVRDVAGSLKRRRMSDYEDEAYSRDESSLVLLTESQDCVGKRCVCISNILRSLTFIPGNEAEFAKSSIFLGLVGKLLLLHHEHPPRTQKTRNYDREEDADFSDSCSSLQGEAEWWWEFLLQIRENVLVSTSNIAGQINLDNYSEEVARPLLDGLLHWAICPSAQGQDPFPSVGPSSLLSPQRLALEALCKLCVTNSNVDLVIATPPFWRLIRLCTVLTKHLCRSEDQVLREFSINLLHYLAAADSSMARVVAMQQPCVSLLVAFIEQAEQSALGVANQHGIGALRDNPDSMGTSLDMLRRAASTLVFLAEHPENKPLLVQQESRLLALVMSQILDQQVALLLSKVLYKISQS